MLAKCLSSVGPACEASSRLPPLSPFPPCWPTARPFPQRNLIVFLTFCVIVRNAGAAGRHSSASGPRPGLAGAAGPNCEEQEARRIVIEAAVSHLEDAKEKDSEESAGLYETWSGITASVWQAFNRGGNQDETADHERYLELSRETLRIERETAISLRNEGRINDEVLRRIERELDLSESRLMADG